MLRFKIIPVLFLLFFVLHSYADLTNPYLRKQLRSLNKNRDKSMREEYFSQITDHFDASNTATFLQKYYVAEGTSKIAFLMINGEAPMDDFDGGYWATLAAEVGAFKFQLEHRYYGQSQPFGDLSDESIRFLSSEQALADCATFIAAMNKKYDLGSDVVWVAFGGSYAGALSAWLRYKYPHLVRAAVSSSGPIEPRLDFSDYLRIATYDFGAVSESCLFSMAAGFEQMKEAYDNLDPTLKDTVGICEDLTEEIVSDPLTTGKLFDAFTHLISNVAQYDGLLATGISTYCSIMDSEGMTELQRLGVASKLVMSTVYNQTCESSRYYDYVQQVKNPSLDSSSVRSGSRQWKYQCCSEFGFHEPTDTTIAVFGDVVPLSYYTQMCQDIFGDTFDEQFQANTVNNTNIMRGGKLPEVSNVVFVQGTKDPWYALGLTETTDRSGPAIFIEGGVHCEDAYDPATVNRPELEAARASIRQYILDWISDE